MARLDLVIVFLYLTGTLVFGIIVGLRQTGSGFWVDDRRSHTLLLAVSVIATQVGAGVIIGLASATYLSGIGLTVVSTVSLCIGMFGIGLLAPALKRFGDKYQAIGLPELFGVRYGRSTQIVASLLVLFTYLSFLAAQFVAVAGLLNVWSGVGFKSALVYACLGVVVYTAFAGLRGDLMTDFIHFWVMVIAFFAVLTPILIREIPDPSQAFPPEFWSPAHFAGWPFLVVGVVLGGVLPMVSMEVWQRAYAAVTPRAARTVFWVAPLIVLPFYIFATYLGMCAQITNPDLANPDLAPFAVLNTHLPLGVLGLTIAALLATFLSTANSMALVISATVYRDVFSKPTIGVSVRSGRTWTFVAGAFGLLAAWIVPSIVQLTLNAFYMLGMLFLPLIGGLFWRRATARAATISIVLGGLVTFISLPFAPKLAFLPGLLLSWPLFIILSLITSHSQSETRQLWKQLGDIE
jgi:SSS family solute:Na+ symporter